MELKTSVITALVTLLNDAEEKAWDFQSHFHKVPEDTNTEKGTDCELPVRANDEEEEEEDFRSHGDVCQRERKSNRAAGWINFNLHLGGEKKEELTVEQPDSENISLE